MSQVEPSIVFLVGARRTGSTVLYSLICSSPDTHDFVGEFQILTQLLQAFGWARANYDRLVRFYFRDVTHFESFRLNTIRALVGEALTTFARYRCAVFKNPELSLYVGDLARAFPKAKFVATVRDPRDQAASELAVIERQLKCGMRLGAPPTARQLAASFSAYCNPVLTLQRAAPDRVRFVRYEDLVQTPAETVASVCSFLGISAEGIDPTHTWNFGSVDPALMQARPSWTELYGQPLTHERIGCYVAALKPSEIDEIENETVAVRRAFGYGPLEGQQRALQESGPIRLS